MKIEKINLRNFRNIENCEFDLADGINVITGKNGQGKTNFLESIYYLSTTRSFRVSKDQELIMHGKPLAKMDCSMIDDDLKKHLCCVIHDKGKTCFVANQQIPRTSEYIGKLNAILFAPSDLELFTSSPRERRKLMDIEIGKIDSFYSNQLNRYNKLLKERNSFLKQNKRNDDYLDVLENQMAESSMLIIERRNYFVEFINEHLTKRYQQLSNEDSKILCYYSSVIENSQEDGFHCYIDKMKENRERDFILKSTSVGIHRDDLIFKMNDKVLDSVASQGQRRMVILSLKMSFIDFVIEKTKKIPVLLLDDVLSELDLEKRHNLFKTIPSGIQTIITATELDDVIEELPLTFKTMVMNQGRVTE